MSTDLPSLTKSAWHACGRCSVNVWGMKELIMTPLPTPVRSSPPSPWQGLMSLSRRPSAAPCAGNNYHVGPLGSAPASLCWPGPSCSSPCLSSHLQYLRPSVSFPVPVALPEVTAASTYCPCIECLPPGLGVLCTLTSNLHSNLQGRCWLPSFFRGEMSSEKLSDFAHVIAATLVFPRDHAP